MSEQTTKSKPASEAPITWVDVARTLAQLDPTSTEWSTRPASLSRAHVDWLGATFEFSGEQPDADLFLAWLDTIFPQRIEREDDKLAFLLEGPTSGSRLPIELLSVEPSRQIAQPSLGAIESSISFSEQESPAKAGVPIIACHSVKGGNGRTTTAIACALAWAERTHKPILIVDADLEAPGLSYLYQRSRGVPQVAFEDVVALAHSDLSPGRAETVKFVAERLRSQKWGDIFVLPLRRDLDELASSALRAEHLADYERPFALADVLRAVAAEAGCAGIVVDLRAGLAPISAQFILDPGVGRIVVSSIAGQSLDGTVSLFTYLARESRRRGIALDPPLLVLNRIPSLFRDTGADEGLLRPVLEKITYELTKGREIGTGVDEPIYELADDIEPLRVVKLSEIADLQVSSPEWEGFVRQLRTSAFLKTFSDQVAEWLERYSAETEATRTASASVVDAQTVNWDTLRTKLKDFAGRFVAAELASKPVDTPLITGPLLALADQFTTQLPIVVAEGAKGTGKTLTARYLVAQKDWAAAVKSLSGQNAGTNALILPVLGSIQSSDTFQSEMETRRKAIAAELGFGTPQPLHETKAYLSDGLSKAVSEAERTSAWMNAIAWSAGYDVGDASAGSRLSKRLRDEGQHILAVVEGVEELYVDPYANETAHWLRSLLVDLPQRLRSEPLRPMGLIVFVRRDSVEAAVHQNIDQFRRMYQSFALSWSENDVLELAAWLTTKSEAAQIWDASFRDLPQLERERRLFPLWGRKLGPDDRPNKRTAEAYTANWVVAVLSDLQSRLVARDLVRLLENAAAFPVNAADVELSKTRLLVPRALKDAVKPTSVAKVRETQEEISELKPVFSKFGSQPDRVVAPLDQAAIDALGLSQNDIALLQRHAILFGEAAPYEVPELFRMGLNLKHGGARHSVINLRRRARQRLGLPG